MLSLTITLSVSIVVVVPLTVKLVKVPLAPVTFPLKLAELPSAASEPALVSRFDTLPFITARALESTA